MIVLIAAWLCVPSALCEGDTRGETQLTGADVATLMNVTSLIYREKGDTNQPSAAWLSFQKYLKFGANARVEIEELLKKGIASGAAICGDLAQTNR